MCILKQFQQFISGNRPCGIRAIKQPHCKFLLLFMKFDDLVFYGIARDDSVNCDWPYLTKSMCTVGSLVLDGWIPPWIKNNDIVRSRQVQAQPACAQADEKQIRMAFLEISDRILPFFGWCRAVQILVGDA